MIRLLIADDHAIVREGLKQLVKLTQDICVTAEAANGSETLDMIHSTEIDLLLLDMNMPGINGIELIALVKYDRPALPIFVYSMYDDLQMANDAFKAGASGYFTKSSDPKVLMAAIRKVYQGEQYLDPAIANK